MATHSPHSLKEIQESKMSVLNTVAEQIQETCKFFFEYNFPNTRYKVKVYNADEYTAAHIIFTPQNEVIEVKFYPR